MRYQSFYPFSNNQPPMRPGPPPSPMPGGGIPGGGMRQPFAQGMMPSNQGLQQAGGSGQQAGSGNLPSRADQYMQTANRFLNTAQQFAPLVQQFAPMVQNLPAMWKLYKGFQSMPNAPVTQNPIRPGSSPASQGAPTSAATPVNQPSTPRIFQPPF
ncbi:VrrA/YqfQ family protein [Sporosarcina obsidiansis]|uniref:VrrA/YqfQ family protein n=1 Tax=Sporosarcina obsidiansis TaxID=2660748 RepID=UPI00129AF204|nr:VrrA/YqfQ family protein [Sporosarcina obsidiansis]